MKKSEKITQKNVRRRRNKTEIQEGKIRQKIQKIKND